jgi:NaMN:DMB phosphoribosyltransferase
MITNDLVCLSRASVLPGGESVFGGNETASAYMLTLSADSLKLLSSRHQDKKRAICEISFQHSMHLMPIIQRNDKQIAPK